MGARRRAVKPTRILIADDHHLIREGFKKLLNKERDLDVVGEAADAEGLLKLARKIPCDVVVLDIAMPGKSGLDLLGDLKSIGGGLKVLMLTMHPEERFAVRALKSGAQGYITKETAPEELVAAVRRVAAGKKYVSPGLADKLAAEVSGGFDKLPHEKLSAREYQVFALIARGKSPEDISSTLHLSKSTVNTYRQRILEKMGLATNAEIIHYAARNGLTD
jgi:two-component system invasion response regulator UvrY